MAAPLVEAIAAGETVAFRICANDACRWVFEDTSRAGRRRWCDMASCGNRAKVRRYRSKPAADDDDAAHDGPVATDATPSDLAQAQPRSSSGRTSVAKRVIDSSS